MSKYAAASAVRKPLLEAEAGAVKRTILVTGGTGYIGSRVVERLLVAGHEVHVLARPRATQDPEDMLAYLKRLPGAPKHLKIVPGDVTDSGALVAAMQGCEQLVHLAGVVDIRQPDSEEEKQEMLNTALQGTRLALDAATAAGSIRKVITCSSVVACLYDWWERGRDYVYTEDDWTLDSSVALNTYAYCKRESERLAWSMAAGKRWELVTVNPGIVFGPVVARKLADSVSVKQPIVQHMNGDKFPFTSDVHITHVDLDDVAAAICGLLATPGASGRHLLLSGSPPSMVTIAGLLARFYPQAKVPPLCAPRWLVAQLAKHRSKQLGLDYAKFKAMHGKSFKVDASKIQRVLPGFEYTSLADSVKAAADSVVALGLAAPHPLSLRGPAVAEADGGELAGGGRGWAKARRTKDGSGFAVVAEIRLGGGDEFGGRTITFEPEPLRDWTDVLG